MGNIGNHHFITVFLADNLYYLLIGILVINLLQRRYQRYSHKKRIATVYIAGLVLYLIVFSIIVIRFKLSDILLIPNVLCMAILIYFAREKIFPFQLRCRKCGKNLPFKRIIFFDSNSCENCDPLSREVHDGKQKAK